MITYVATLLLCLVVAKPVIKLSPKNLPQSAMKNSEYVAIALHDDSLMSNDLLDIYQMAADLYSE